MRSGIHKRHTLINSYTLKRKENPYMRRIPFSDIILSAGLKDMLIILFTCRSLVLQCNILFGVLLRANTACLDLPRNKTLCAYCFPPYLSNLLHVDGVVSLPLVPLANTETPSRNTS